MKNHPLYQLASKLRPELEHLDGVAQLQAFSEVFAVLYLMPFSIIGLIFLVLNSSHLLFFENILLLGLLAAGILVTNAQTAAIYVEIGPGEKLALTSSFGSVLYWAGVLLWGPVTIWASLLADLITNLRGAAQMRRLNLNIVWGPLASFLQSLMPINGVLLALWIYTTMGGAFPISGVNLTDWFPALTAIIVSSIFPGLVLLPIFYMITALTKAKSTFISSIRFVISAIAFNIIPAPFGIPIALLYVKTGVWPFIAMVIGIILVNSLAHHLSRTNQRNMKQAQEMSELEKLGEEIIQLPPDGSTFEEILRGRLASMFSSQLDIVAVHIFEDANLPGYTDQNAPLHIIHPRESLAPDASDWETLRSSQKDYLVLKDQVPNGFKSIYGNAVLVKIISAAPTAESESPACIGGIYLLMNKVVARTIDSLSVLQALASQIASAIYRSQVYKETLEAQKMSQELAFAGKIQSSFLPENVPSADGWRIAATLIPARQTSGDFYDFIELPGSKLGILIADVADKGTGAALYMALSRTLLRTFAFQYPDEPAEVFRLTNDRLFEDSRADQFVTVFYGVLEYETGRFEYCNAGHNPTFLLRADSEKQPEALKRTGIVLGAMEGLTWNSASTTLNPGDFLLFYTDGVVEAQNEQDEFFGEEQFLQIARENKNAPADVIHAHLMEKLHTFVGSAAQFDDITMLTIKRQE